MTDQSTLILSPCPILRKGVVIAATNFRSPCLATPFLPITVRGFSALISSFFH